jgi:hypothetical protein
MPTAQDIGTMAGNMALSRAGQAAGIPVPIPTIQEFNQIRQGNYRNAAGRYGRRLLSGAIDRATMFNPITGLLNLGWKGAGLLTGHPDWGLGNFVTSHIFNNDQPQPTGHVTVGDINDTSGFGNYQIDPWTGAPMPEFSSYGPYASGYQYPNSYNNSTPTLPDFSNYGNDLVGGGGDRSDYVTLDGGLAGGGNDFGLGSALAGGGWSNVMNGASPGMMADFAAPTNGDWMQRIDVKLGQGGASTSHGASRR